MKALEDKCKGCGACVPICPQGAIKLKKKLAVVGEACSDCGVCAKICPEGACVPTPPATDAVACESCPVRCSIKPGFFGACQRYVNRDGALERTIALQTYEDVRHLVGPDWAPVIREPLITAIGGGATYPDCKPAPQIVQSNVHGIDVVTVVTEAPLSYSGVKIKVDTDRTIGEEGAPIFYRKKKVGLLITEEYGSKILSIGGVNVLTGSDGFTAAKLVSDLANRKKAKLVIAEGGTLEVRVGQKPVINGLVDNVMRVGCGSATLGLFASHFRDCADEAIVIDSHITGLMSEHAAGKYVGVKPSGVRLKFRVSTPGRYFGDHGPGWGGTSVTEPLDLIAEIDMNVARIGMTILITETTGQNHVLVRLREDGSLEKIPSPEAVKAAIAELADTCEPSRVSGIYCGGSGGSARAGVTRSPIKLTRAVHDMKARLTVGGAPTYVLPGGGINFMVDVEKVMAGAFTWVPTPATVCPIEYTMTLSDYIEMGGHSEAIKPFKLK